MKIDCIFADRLFSFQFEGEKENELAKILKSWNDPVYLHSFTKVNKSDLPKNIDEFNFINQIIDDANNIDDKLLELSKSDNLNQFFKSLDNNEYQFKILSKRKGRQNYLRIYALKINDNCFVVTGGAIKLTKNMDEREHTRKELIKIEQCKAFLKENSVHDEESFYEFLLENI